MEQDLNDNMLSIGDSAPDFELPGIDGNSYSLGDFNKEILVLVFTCNHCPYALAYHGRTVKLQGDFHEKVQFIGINSNDANGYPEDSFEKMKEREDDFNYPYLRDEDQSVAQAYGAQCTPEVFVFDSERKLRYHGRIDDNWQNAEKITSHDLRMALAALSSGEAVPEPETSSIGCSIKWLG